MNSLSAPSLQQDLMRFFRSLLLAVLLFQVATSGWIASSVLRSGSDLAVHTLTVQSEWFIGWSIFKSAVAIAFLLFLPWRSSTALTWVLGTWLFGSIAIDFQIGAIQGARANWFFFWLTIGIVTGLLTLIGFRTLKIQGKLLLVCLVAAGLPMFMVGVALSQQYQFIERHALPTVAREALIWEAARLDHAVKERMTNDLASLLGIGQAELKRFKHSFEIASPTVFWERAARLGIPVLGVKAETVLKPLNLDLRDVPMQFALQMIARACGLNLVVKGRLPTQQVSITGRNLSLEEMLAQIDAVSPIIFKRAGDQLVVQSVEPGESPAPGQAQREVVSRRSITINSSRSKELAELCAKYPDARAEARIDITGEQQTLTLFLFQRGAAPEELQGVTKLAIDLGVWLKHLMLDHPLSDASGSFCLHSTAFSALKPVFPHCSMISSVEDKPVSTGKFFEQRELLLYQSFSHLIRDGKELIELENTARSPTPALIGPSPDLRLMDTTGKEWLLQGWNLPKSMTTVTFVVPVCTLRGLLLDKQRQPLLLAVIAILMALSLSYTYSRGMSLPLQAITEAARRIRDGDLDVRIPAPGGNDEIRELSETLEVMADRLKGRIVSANQRLLEEKYKFETLLESTWEGIFLLTPEGNLGYANQAGRQLLGEAALNKPLTELLQAIGQEFQPPLPPTFAGITGDFRTHFQLPDPDGGKRKVLALYLRLLPESLGMLAVCRDITVEKEIDRMKSEFVSQVSHELRTPLTSIQAYTEMLLDGEAEDAVQQKDYLGIILDESQRLTRLINDLLDIARIESGKRVLKPVKLDLATLTREIVLILGGQAERRKLTIETSVPAEPVWFTGDADLIKQAGLNLLSNALKYTPEGGRILVTAEALPGPHVAWRFTDFGIGMTPQERDRLFTKFFRADSEYVKNAGGTGLGLTLVKQIVDRHSGEIKVESEFGKGSTFTILFPGQLAV